MATYEFGGSLYRNSTEMHEAIVVAWLSADGSNTREDMQEALGALSDQALAEECTDVWFYYNDSNSEFDLVELEREFANIRDNFDKHFPTLPPYQP